MKPIILKQKKFILVGISFYGDPFAFSGEWTEENEIGRLWKRFFQLMGNENFKIPKPVETNAYYEVCIQNPIDSHTGFFEIFIGYEIQEKNMIPIDFQLKILPISDFAVFTVSGSKINEDWYYQAIHKWLPEFGYIPNSYYSIQRYDDRFKGMDKLSESVMDVYFPVIKRDSRETNQ